MARDGVEHQCIALAGDLEELVTPLQQIQPIENGAGKGVDLPVAIGRGGLPAEHPAQVIARPVPRGRRKDEEVSGDQMQAEAREGAPDAQRKEHAERDERRATTLAVLRPLSGVRTHPRERCISGLAGHRGTTPPWPVTVRPWRPADRRSRR